ncbi:MAG TPA: AAA family ATPase [Nocardioidaceae bacterium]|nr:AAA family ATPase [Nocardioidaceae bacterium]
MIPTDGSALTDRWVTELRSLGFRDPARPAQLSATKPGTLDRPAAVDEVLSRLGARRSGWNAADVRGEVEQLIARAGVVTDASIRCELAEDLTARVLDACLPLLPHDPPEHVRALTSLEVLRVEADLTTRMAARAAHPGTPAAITGGRIDESQCQAVAALAGTHRLVVVEGAAGAGKTAALRATRSIVERQGRRMVVVTPTLKAAQVAASQVGTRAFSAAWLAHQHGYRWDEHGRWNRANAQPSPAALLKPGDLLVIDEAGMLDQDTARALLTLADEADANVAFLGDRHQLPAVGRGGVLDHAARWAHPKAVVTLDRVHRFTDPTYAHLTLAMRDGENPAAVFDQLAAHGQIVLHASEQARTQALAAEAAASGALVIADTREQVADLNAAIRDRLVATGRVDDQRVVVTTSGERVGVGDRVATRRNDYDLGVANRDTWTVALVEPDGHLHLTNGRADRVVDPHYVRSHVELAYATTVHGAQGDTVPTAHLCIAEHTGAAAAYVGMTRGRDTNSAHLVADTLEEARQQWVEVFARDRADLGPAHAARLAAQEAAKYGAPWRPTAPGRYASPNRRKRIARPAPQGAPVPPPVRPGDHQREPLRPPGIGL